MSSTSEQASGYRHDLRRAGASMIARRRQDT
jgi:hypothetical protein